MQNDLLHEFIDKVIVTFCNTFRSCVAVVGGQWQNSLFKYRVSYRHLTFMIEAFNCRGVAMGKYIGIYTPKKQLLLVAY